MSGFLPSRPWEPATLSQPAAATTSSGKAGFTDEWDNLDMEDLVNSDNEGDDYSSSSSSQTPPPKEGKGGAALATWSASKYGGVPTHWSDAMPLPPVGMRPINLLANVDKYGDLMEWDDDSAQLVWKANFTPLFNEAENRQLQQHQQFGQFGTPDHMPPPINSTAAANIAAAAASSRDKPRSAKGSYLFLMFIMFAVLLYIVIVYYVPAAVANREDNNKDKEDEKKKKQQRRRKRRKKKNDDDDEDEVCDDGNSDSEDDEDEDEDDEDDDDTSRQSKALGLSAILVLAGIGCKFKYG